MFLRERPFQHEHLNLEFKEQFPIRSGGKYEVRDVCKYIAGFSNEEGGIVVYGVADTIRDRSVVYPDYVKGLSQWPSIEDLSQWVIERVTPLVQSPAIRWFKVDAKDVAVVKVPVGLNRPYAYREPSTNALTFFKKTAGNLKELNAAEVKDLYWDAILQQSSQILSAGMLRGMDVSIPAEDPFAKHRERVQRLLEDPTGFGWLSIYCVPTQQVHIPVDELKRFLDDARGKFAEILRYFPSVEIAQSTASAGYFPTAIRKDIKSTARVTLYTDGLTAYDSQADMAMDRDGNLHPFWLSYEIQRHLQLAKALFEGRGVSEIRVTIDLANIERFSIRWQDPWHFDVGEAKYTGAHERIHRRVRLDDIHSAFGSERDIVFPAVKDLMNEIFRIFGVDRAPALLWDSDGRMTYVKGLEGQR